MSEVVLKYRGIKTVNENAKETKEILRDEFKWKI